MTGNRFEACLAHVLKHEGFYSDDPCDPGGKTMRGITQRVYDAWRERQGKARAHVWDIAKDEIEAIYRANYWAVVRADELPAGLDLAVFDFAVNSGPTRPSAPPARPPLRPRRASPSLPAKGAKHLLAQPLRQVRVGHVPARQAQGQTPPNQQRPRPAEQALRPRGQALPRAL